MSKKIEFKIAETLTRLAREKGLSLTEISKGVFLESGVRVSVSTLSDWSVKSNRPVRDIRALTALAHYLGVSLHFMIYGREENEQTGKTTQEKSLTENISELWNGSGMFEVTLRVSKVKKVSE